MVIRVVIRALKQDSDGTVLLHRLTSVYGDSVVKVLLCCSRQAVDLSCHASLPTQVDVSASTAAADAADKLPAWTATPAEEAQNQAAGTQAASMISNALAGMGLGANPWEKLGGTVMRRKPHKAADRAYQSLLEAQVRYESVSSLFEGCACMCLVQVLSNRLAFTRRPCEHWRCMALEPAHLTPTHRSATASCGWRTSAA